MKKVTMHYRVGKPDKEGYPTYEITLNAKDFGVFLDNPTPKGCRFLAEWVIDFMLDPDAISAEVNDFALREIEDRIALGEWEQ